MFMIVNSVASTTPTSPSAPASCAKFKQPPPTPAQLKQMKDNGLVAYEDYVAWGAVEREPGQAYPNSNSRNHVALHKIGNDVAQQLIGSAG